MTLSATIKSARERMGITQEQLANRSFCSKALICYIETGRTLQPEHELLRRIGRCLGLNTDKLIDMLPEPKIVRHRDPWPAVPEKMEPPKAMQIKPEHKIDPEIQRRIEIELAKSRINDSMDCAARVG